MALLRLALTFSAATIVAASYNETDLISSLYNQSLVGANAEVTLTDCGDGTGVSNVQFDYSPKPAVVGQPITITGKVTYGFTDTNPNYNIQANFGAIKLIPNKNQDGSLCQANTINLLLNVGKIEISAVNTGCPVPSGDVQLSVQIPVAPLHGTVLGHFNIYKADKSKAVCLDLSVKV